MRVRQHSSHQRGDGLAKQVFLESVEIVIPKLKIQLRGYVLAETFLEKEKQQARLNVRLALDLIA
jgi:hypothetical protein